MRCARSSVVGLALVAGWYLPGCGATGEVAIHEAEALSGDYHVNPAGAGFDAKGSDRKAIAIADDTMAAMGGRRAWDDTRCIEWTFFGRRKHVWDKQTGDYRLEDGKRVVLMNLNTGQGRVFDGQDELHDKELVQEALQKARSIWINDSYWLLMPYKLKDGGVTLKYKGEDKLKDGRACDVLTLTFAKVGDTPDNKYDVWVGKDSRLVEQWAYYKDAQDAEPKFKTPWAGWLRYGGILISGDRGAPDRQLTDIAVLEEPPAGIHAAN